MQKSYWSDQVKKDVISYNVHVILHFHSIVLCTWHIILFTMIPNKNTFFSYMEVNNRVKFDNIEKKLITMQSKLKERFIVK